MVAIEDMEMSECCSECDMCRQEIIFDGCSVNNYCSILNQDITLDGRRDDNCPLKEVVTCGKCNQTYLNEHGFNVCKLNKCEVPDYGFCMWGEHK